MASWTHRKSRKQFFRYGQPLAPNNDTSGKNVNAFRRVLFAQYPPMRALFSGRVVRNRLLNTGEFPSINIHTIIIRFIPAKIPWPDTLKGKAVRRDGFSKNIYGWDGMLIIGNPRSQIDNSFRPVTIGNVETQIGG